MKKFIPVAMAIAVMAAPATSWGETREVTVTCPDRQVVVRTVSCEHGQMISVHANCAGKKFLARVQCTAAVPVAAVPLPQLQAGLGLLGGATLFGKADVGGAGSLDLTLCVRLKDKWGLLFVGALGAGNRPGGLQAVFPWTAGLGPSYKGGWGRVSLLALGLGARGRGNESAYQGAAGGLRGDFLLLRKGRGGIALTLAAYGGPAWRLGSLTSAAGALAGLGWLF